MTTAFTPDIDIQVAKQIVDFSFIGPDAREVEKQTILMCENSIVILEFIALFMYYQRDNFSNIDLM